jgi:dTMP kinase
MDLGLSNDPYESFRLFQGRMLEQYLQMSKEFNFVEIDANSCVEEQQSVVRHHVAGRVPLDEFGQSKSTVYINQK